MSQISRNNYLCRYTSLPFLLDILYNKRLTFVDPENWDDKNDTYFIKLYKDKSGMGSVLALCFVEYLTKDSEKYHHWKVYSGNTSGVSIQFEKDKLLPYLQNDQGITSDTVTYMTVKELKNYQQKLSWKKLPFIKRKAYDGETEFRLIFETKEHIKSMPFKIGLDCISRITFNPWIVGPDNRSVYDALFNDIKKIDGCESIKLNNTTINDYQKWKLIGDEIANAPR